MDEIDPLARPRRRTFTAAEKLAYLDAYDELNTGRTGLLMNGHTVSEQSM